MSAELSSELLGDDWLAQEVGAFDVAVRGYNKQQVEERLTQYGEALSQTAHERDIALDQAEQARAAALRGSAAEITSGRLREILVLGEQEAAQMRADAQAELGSAVADARAESARLRAEATEAADRERRDAELEARRIVEAARAEADRLIGAAEEAARDLTMTTERNRRLATAEHEQLLAAQREEHEVVLDGLRRDVGDLAARRDTVRAEISHLRDVLATMVGLPATAAETELPLPPAAAPSRAGGAAAFVPVPAAASAESAQAAASVDPEPATDEHLILGERAVVDVSDPDTSPGDGADGVFDQEAAPRPAARRAVAGRSSSDRRAPAVTAIKRSR